MPIIRDMKKVVSFRISNDTIQGLKDYGDEYDEFQFEVVEQAINFLFKARIEYEDQREKHGDNIADVFEDWLEDIL